MAKKQIKQSDTVEVMRSQINLNPYNPKRHSDKKILDQKKNLLRVGLLGGITWNKASGNLIDGHRRIKAMDMHYGYDGTPATDYSVKVTAVELDDKQEKEQMTYMALGNTKADYSLIAEYLPDIDAVAAGIDDYDLSQIQSFIPTVDEVVIDTFDDLISDVPEEDGDQDGPDAPDMADDAESDDAPEPTPEERKAKIKEAKEKQREAAGERYADLNAYITVSFDNAEQKRTFCELLGIQESEMFVKGSMVLNAFE